MQEFQGQTLICQVPVPCGTILTVVKPRDREPYHQVTAHRSESQKSIQRIESDNDAHGRLTYLQRWYKGSPATNSEISSRFFRPRFAA